MRRWVLLAILAIAIAFAAGRLLNLGQPSLPEDCVAAGQALEAGDYDGAIDGYLACLDRPDLSEAVLAQIYYGLGLAYSAKGNHYQAIEDYASALEFAPNFPWAWNNRCWSLALLRRAEEALSDCNEAVRLAPDEPAILDSRALAYWLMDRPAEARQDLDRAHRLDPSTPTPDERFQQFEELF